MKKATKTIWVNPVPRTSAQGRHNQVYTMNMNLITGVEGGLIPSKRMNKNKEFGIAETFHFPIDPLRQKLVTGLDKSIENPFKDLVVQNIITNYNLSEEWRTILNNLVTRDNINKQTYFEIKHSVNPNYYNSEVKYFMSNMPQDMSLFDKERTFLQDLKLVLYDRPNPFDNSSPRQELLMEMVYALPKIANSKMDINPSLHSWYISEENEEEAQVARRKEIIEEASYNMHILKREYGDFRAFQMASILLDNYGQPIVKGKVGADLVSAKLSSFVQDKTSEQLINIKKFMSNMELLKSKDGYNKFYTKYLVQQAINTNVIANRDNQYIWHSKAGTPDVYELGSSYEGLVNFFLKEFNEYNPKSDLSNWYKDLSQELLAKGIKLDE